MQIVSALQFQKTLSIYDGTTLTRTLYTTHPLSSVTMTLPEHYNSREPLLLATEHNQLSVWDVRMGERGGCVKRIMVCVIYYVYIYACVVCVCCVVYMYVM